MSHKTGEPTPQGEQGYLCTKILASVQRKSAKLASGKICRLFSAHYLRLGAAGVAGRVLEQVVHKTSLVQSAEPELSRTPGTKADPGGRDNGGEAQSTNEPARPTPRKRKTAWVDDGGRPRKFQFKLPTPSQHPPQQERQVDTANFDNGQAVRKHPATKPS